MEVAKKIADAFVVSLDYLVGEGQNATFDKKTMQGIQEIQNLDTDTQAILLISLILILEMLRLEPHTVHNHLQFFKKIISLLFIHFHCL